MTRRSARKMARERKLKAINDQESTADLSSPRFCWMLRIFICVVFGLKYKQAHIEYHKAKGLGRNHCRNITRIAIARQLASGEKQRLQCSPAREARSNGRTFVT
jgi:hypothetical protein